MSESRCSRGAGRNENKPFILDSSSLSFGSTSSILLVAYLSGQVNPFLQFVMNTSERQLLFFGPPQGVLYFLCTKSYLAFLCTLGFFFFFNLCISNKARLQLLQWHLSPCLSYENQPVFYYSPSGTLWRYWNLTTSFCGRTFSKIWLAGCTINSCVVLRQPWTLEQ